MPIADSACCRCAQLDEGDVAKAVHQQQGENRSWKYLAQIQDVFGCRLSWSEHDEGDEAGEHRCHHAGCHHDDLLSDSHLLSFLIFDSNIPKVLYLENFFLVFNFL